MRKFSLGIFLPLFIGMFIMGCTEKEELTREIITLKAQIETAKEVELLTSERDQLQAELDKFQLRPEGNVADINSSS